MVISSPQGSAYARDGMTRGISTVIPGGFSDNNPAGKNQSLGPMTPDLAMDLTGPQYGFGAKPRLPDDWML